MVKQGLEQLTFLAALSCAIALSFVVLWVPKASAQRISIDGRLSPAQTLTGPNYAIGAGLGRQVGGNLFHSFGVFGLSQGETATFSGPPSVSNVIGRVTGGAASSIDGKIQSTIPGANVYLVNPAGIVFGQHATVNVTGSFHASSADYLRLTDGARFQATNPNASTLTAAAPAAFGFLSAAPGPVTVNGSAIGPVTGRLALVGGPVTISNGVLLAPGGTVHISSAAGPGEIPVDPRSGPAATVGQYGPVVASNTRIAISDASGRASGSVFVRGGTVSVSGGEIDADNYSAAPGGTLGLRGETAIGLSHGANVHAFARAGGSGANISITTADQGAVQLDAANVTASTGAPGAAGGITIDTGLLAMTNAAQVLDGTVGPGAGGPINVLAANTVLSGKGTGLRSLTGNLATSSAGLLGPGGIVNLSGNNLTIGNGAAISTGTIGAGRGGDIRITLTGAAALGTTGESGGSSIQTLALGTGTGGNVKFASDSLKVSGISGIITGSLVDAVAGSLSVAARTMELRDFASITSNGAPALLGISTSSQTMATSGSVTVTASGLLALSGGDANTPGSTIGGSTFSAHAGGDVFVRAGALSLGGTSSIASYTFGGGAAGNVSVAASGPLMIDRPSELAETGVKPGIDSLSKNAALGPSGNVTVSARDITIQNGLINADTFTAGPAGTVHVTAVDTLTIAGPSGSQSNYFAGISAQSNNTATRTGRGGDVSVQAGSVTIASQGEISSSTFSPADAGNVSVTANRAITIVGNGITDGISSTAFPQSSGRAGTVQVSAANISLINTGAEISSATLGTSPGVTSAGATAAGGSVAVTASDSLSLTGGDASTFGSKIDANTSSGYAGGGVSVQARDITLAGTSTISSNTSGDGRAGDVTVAASGDLLISRPSALVESQVKPGIDSLTNSLNAAARGGDVTVSAHDITINNGLINADTNGAASAGRVNVTATGALTISGAVESRFISGISAEANRQASDPVFATAKGGDVLVQAGSVLLTKQGEISSETFTGGNAGGVMVIARGGVTIIGGVPDKITGITSQADDHSSGNAGTVRVSAGNISVDGVGAQITSATRSSSSDAGIVSVSAGSITVQGGALINSSTSGAGHGGSVTVRAGGDISLNGPGPQIATSSTGTGNAGSIIIAARRLTMSNGASISTQAESANGGNITISAGDMLWLQHSAITTSVNGELGNGGNIQVDPQFVILDSSVIQANAVGGNGGNVNVVANEIVSSFDSAITASSQKGLSGNIVLSGPQLDLNSSLVVLASTLRSAAALLRESCAGRGDRPRSSLVVAGAGGIRDEAQTSVSALYIANRPVRGDRARNAAVGVPAVPVTLALAAPCS